MRYKSFPMKKFTVLFSFILFGFTAYSQTVFTKADTLRGSLNENRDWFDIKHYLIDLKPNIENKTIQGEVRWYAITTKTNHNIQIDLQKPLIIDQVLMIVGPLGRFKLDTLDFTRENNIAIAFPKTKLEIGEEFELIITYFGKPREAIRPPWDGGWIWKKDANGNPWISVACQGLGASVWYPCKDIQSDEPDNGATIDIQIPKKYNIKAISNGRPRNVEFLPFSNDTIFSTRVTNPINNYNIIPYIGDYVGWSEQYKGLKGDLDINYWVLREDAEKAKKQFTQVPQMLKAFEYWFGPYPFYEDGFQMIQSPHLGMEHQSAIAYGNKFANGYLGRDLSGSGWGLKWDYIIVHESGHEWFANNITTKDIADMWVHEGFTSYAETLYTEYYYGKEAGDDYTYGLRKRIMNDGPIIGHYGVNNEGSGDMYAKGAVMLHSIRKSINNDSLFRSILIGLNKDFYHQTVTTEQIENYISTKSGINFSKVFDQYLRNIQIPVFAYSYDKKEKILTYQWKNCVNGFNLPLHFKYEGQQFDFLPADYIPQKRLIKLDNFNEAAFGDAIKRLYYVQINNENNGN
jgi:aminopeptidase N